MKNKRKKNLKIVRYNPNCNEGLTSDQVKDRTNQKLVNNTKQRSSKSVFRIITDNVFTFFNFIWVIIFIALVLVKSYGDLLFVIAITINTLISIIQELKAKFTVEKLSIVTLPKVKVVRNSQTIMVPIKSLVLDDIVYLEIGNQIPADCVVIDGRVDCNESLLTGESNAVKKQISDKMLAGSFILSGACYARIDKVGKGSYIQSIAAEAKKFKSPNLNLNRDLKTMIKFIGISIIPVAVIMFLNNYFSYNQDLNYAVIKTCGAIVGMIPAGMFLLITIALAVGVVKLSKKQTLVQDLFSIEMLARANVLCLDKTGTITDGTMQVTEQINLKSFKDYEPAEIISNILCAQKTNNSTANALLLHYGKSQNFEQCYNLEFDSKRKCTATSFTELGTFIIGAPEFVGVKLTQKHKKIIYQKASQGKRVLMLAHSDKILNEKEILPKQCTALALVVIEDRIREDAIETIQWFKDNDVAIKIISGDNPITVMNIAQRVGVENAEACISLEGLSLQEVEKLATKFTVFGRVSPEQKHTLIKSLKKHGNIVAMTGDGVNDTLALKEADCSIAMADGSEVARNLSNLVLKDSKFSSLPAIVREGRQVVNNVQQSSTLYLMKTIFTIAMSLFTIVTLSGYPFRPAQLFILELFVIGAPSVILALQPNTKQIKGDFIPVVLRRSIPSGLLMVLCVIAVLLLSKAGVINAEEFETLATLTLIATGFINLFFLCLPLTWLRATCLGFSVISIIVTISVMGGFFGMTLFSLKVFVCLFIFILAAIPLHIFMPKFTKWLESTYKRLKTKNKN